MDTGRKPGKGFRLLLLLLAVALVTACGRARPQSQAGAGTARAGQAAEVADTAAQGQVAGSPPGEAAGGATVATEAPEEQQGAPGPTAVPGVPPAEAAYDRKIVLNADISLRVANAREAVARLQNLADFNRGYIVDARLEGTDEDGWNGHVVMRIPAAAYHSAIAAVRELGTVEKERQYSQDVTDQYYDLETRIRIATEYEQELRQLAQKAKSFEEWLKLTQEINETRVRIENMTGQFRRLQNQVEYSTLNVTLRQPPAGRTEVEAPPGLRGRVVHAFRGSALEVWDLAQALIVGLVALIPRLVFLSVLVGLVLLVIWPLRRWLRLARASAPAGGAGPGAEPPAGTGTG